MAQDGTGAYYAIKTIKKELVVQKPTRAKMNISTLLVEKEIMMTCSSSFLATMDYLF